MLPVLTKQWQEISSGLKLSCKFKYQTILKTCSPNVIQSCMHVGDNLYYVGAFQFVKSSYL